MPIIAVLEDRVVTVAGVSRRVARVLVGYREVALHEVQPTDRVFPQGGDLPLDQFYWDDAARSFLSIRHPKR